MPNSPDYSRKWYVMAAVAMGQLMSMIDGSIVNIALPVLVRELNTDFALVQWVVLAYMLVVVTLMLSIGRLADMRDKKKLYLAGFTIFTLGSLLCGLSTHIYGLIFSRVLQALGAVMITALGMAIVTEAFPPSQRGQALGISGLMISIGGIAGPTLGGLILGVLPWRWIFFINLPIGVIGTFLVWRFVASSQPGRAQRFDFPGAAALFFCLLAFLIGLTLGENIGFTQPVTLVLFAACLLLLGLFLWLETRQAQPMIDLHLFNNRLFSLDLLTVTLVFVCNGGVTLLMPFYLQNIRGYAPEVAGLFMSVVPLSMGLTAPASGSLSDRIGTRRLTMIGLGVVLLGFVCISFNLSLNTPPWLFVLSYAPIGIGMGIYVSPNSSSIMGAVPRQRLGVASGLIALTRTLGQASGLAVMGAVWAGQVRLLQGPLWLGDASLASTDIQIAAFHTTLTVISGVIGLAFLMGLAAGRIQRHQPAAAELEK